MKKHKKQAHAHKSVTRHKSSTAHRKTAALEDAGRQDQKTDVSWKSEEGPDALNVHENGPVANEIAGEETK